MAKKGIRISNLNIFIRELLENYSIEEIQKRVDEKYINNEYTLKKYLGGTEEEKACLKKLTYRITIQHKENVKQKCSYFGDDVKCEIGECCGLRELLVEGDINFKLAIKEYIKIIELNKHIINDPLVLRNLTLKFIDCFSVDNEARVWFDRDKIQLYCLDAGLSVISKKFKENTALVNLLQVKNALNFLNELERKYKIHVGEVPVTIEPQIRFFKDQREGIRDDILIENTKAQQESFKEKKPPPKKVIIIPKFDSDYIKPIFDVLKDHFKSKDLKRLQALLDGTELEGDRILFQGTGNSLAYAFRKLHEAKLIEPRIKKILKVWIINNFIYDKKGEENDYNLDYLDKVMSETDYYCASEIMSVERVKESDIFKITKFIFRV